MSAKSSLIIIPTYNEASNIPSLLPLIWQEVPHTHILIIDDNSPDGTGQIVKDLQKNNPDKLFLLERVKKDGLGRAYLAGFRWSLAKDYEKVIQMDADFSHDPKTLPVILEQLQRNSVVIGSRYIEGGGTIHWHIIRKFISRFGSWYARTLLGTKVYDFTGGFNGWRREVLQKVNLDKITSQGYTFQIELKYRANQAGFTIKEVPIVFNERRSGQSKMSSKIILEAMLAVWKLRFSR